MTHRHIMDDEWLVEDIREKFAEEFGELDPPDPNKMWIDPTYNDDAWVAPAAEPETFHVIEVLKRKEDERTNQARQAWMRKRVKEVFG